MSTNVDLESVITTLLKLNFIVKTKEFHNPFLLKWSMSPPLKEVFQTIMIRLNDKVIAN